MHSIEICPILEVQARPLEQNEFGKCSPNLICFSSFGEVPSGLTKVPSTFAKCFDRTGVWNAIRMNLYDGFAAEYEKRHDEIFPELSLALKDAGVSDYSIWLDPQSNHLFGILTRPNDHTMDALPDTEIMKRWWAFMKDIMETNAENVPTQIPLTRVFYLP